MGGAVGDGFTNAPMGKVKGEGVRFGNWTAYAEFNVSVPLPLLGACRVFAPLILCLDIRK
jgi:hypothetical protein